MERMTDGKFRHVPVLDQARLVGIVSIGDVVKHRLEEMERDSEALMRALASRLEFSVLKTGDGFTLLRTVDVMPPVREERLTLKQAEELLQIWKLRGGG
jgi:CBS domain-containing protein